MKHLNFAKKISDLRENLNMTQSDFGKKLGVSNRAVSKWENGGVPDTELLPKIADFFSVSIDSLFGRNISDYSTGSCVRQRLSELSLHMPIIHSCNW